MKTVETLSRAYRGLLDFFYRHTHKRSVMTIEETLRYLLEHRCSVARFGDGEFKLIFGEDIGFQPASELLSDQLRKVLSDEAAANCLVCLPGAFVHRSLYTKAFYRYWQRHLLRRRKQYYSVCRNDYHYGNSDMTRCYLGIRDKENVPNYFRLNRQLWQDRNVLIVEGEMSRLGVGNDLFSNCHSIRRILCPACDAYAAMDRISNAIHRHAAPDDLLLIALGPTATVLCYRLSLERYQAIDIGNIDKEYEWFKNGAKQKQINPIKHTIEIAGGEVEDCLDTTYLREIVEKVE